MFLFQSIESVVFLYVWDLVHDGEVVNDADKMLVFIYHKEGVNFVVTEHVLNLCEFGIGINRFRMARHHILHSYIEEILLGTFHSSTNVTVSDDAEDLLVADGLLLLCCRRKRG